MIACGSLCFTQLSFEEACVQIASLGFDAIDVAVMEGWAHFNPSELVEDLNSALAYAKNSLEKNRLIPVAFNASSKTGDPDLELPRFRAICDFANILEVPIICYGAPAQTEGFENSLKRYGRLLEIAQRHGLTLAVEAHRGTLLERSEVAARFCKALDGVYLTFDPSHMYSGPQAGAPFDEVYPYVRHTHWRDSGDDWDDLQLAVGSGSVDFSGLIQGLQEEGYSGPYSVEYMDTYPNGDHENITAMKSTLEKLTTT